MKLWRRILLSIWALGSYLIVIDTFRTEVIPNGYTFDHSFRFCISGMVFGTLLLILALFGNF